MAWESFTAISKGYMKQYDYSIECRNSLELFSQENVLVSDEGRALIADFRPYHINAAAAEGGPTGPYVTSTLRFTAPELVKNSQMLPTTKSDVWSIGCLVYLVNIPQTSLYINN
jgi:serine/threonine protein kinase